MLGHTEGSGALDSPGLTRFTAGVELHHLFMLVPPAPHPPPQQPPPELLAAFVR